MSGLDILIIAIVLFSIFWSFHKGLNLEFLNFLALVSGLFFAFLTYPLISPFLENLLGGPDIGAAIAFFLTFVIFGGTLMLLGIFFHKFVRLNRFGFFNSILAGILGFLKAFLLGAIVLVVIVAVEGEPTPDYLKKSYFAPPIVSISMGVMNRVPLVFDQFQKDYGVRVQKWLKDFD